METRAVTSVGQVTIPKFVRSQKLNLGPNDRVVFMENDTGDIVIRKSTFESINADNIRTALSEWRSYFEGRADLWNERGGAFFFGQAIADVMSRSFKSELERMEHIRTVYIAYREFEDRGIIS